MLAEPILSLSSSWIMTYKTRDSQVGSTKSGSFESHSSFRRLLPCLRRTCELLETSLSRPVKAAGRCVLVERSADRHSHRFRLFNVTLDLPPECHVVPIPDSPLSTALVLLGDGHLQLPERSTKSQISDQVVRLRTRRSAPER
jgi:hypothetical protein